MFCKIKYIVFKIKILTVLLLSRSFGNLDYVRITTSRPSALARSSSERKNEKLLLKCFSCDSYYEKKFNKELIKK